jgi:hypothetical protein
MSNIVCPHYGDTVPELQRSIADAPSKNFFNDPTIDQGYQYLLTSIKNSAKYETDYQKLKEMHTYLVRLYALLNAYKATLGTTADDPTRATLSTALEQFQAAGDDISNNYDTYADMPKWKQNAVFWGTIFGYIALGLIAGAYVGASFAMIFLPIGIIVCMVAGYTLSTMTAISAPSIIGGIVGAITGGLKGKSDYEEYLKRETKAPQGTFFQTQRDLTSSLATRLVVEPAADEQQEDGPRLQLQA